MEHHIYNSEHNILRVVWGRKISMESIRRHLEMLAKSDRYARDLRIITSSTLEQLDFSLTEENMSEIAGWRSEALSGYRSVRTAFYAVNPVPAAYISFFSQFFDVENSVLRQFYDERMALSWLLHGREPDPILLAG